MFLPQDVLSPLPAGSGEAIVRLRTRHRLHHPGCGQLGIHQLLHQPDTGATLGAGSGAALHSSQLGAPLVAHRGLDGAGVDGVAGTDLGIIGKRRRTGQLGTGGTPGPALVALTLTLTTVGLPLQAVGYLIAIDKVIDMARTALNVTGQLTVPVLVARSEGLLDEAVFNGPPRELTSAPSTPDGTDAAGVDEQAPARDRAAEPVPA